MSQPRSSANRFCPNAVPNTANRDFTAVNRSAAAPVNSAPDRTNICRYSVNTRVCSPVSPSPSRASHNAPIFAHNALLFVTSDENALIFGARSRINASRASVESAPARL